MKTLIAAVVIGVLSFAPSVAPAQRAALVQVEPGARVRGQAPAAGVERFDATVIANTGDTIVIAKNGEVTRLPVERIRRLERYDGRDRKAGARNGALGGAGGGLLFGLLIAGIASGHAERCTDAVPPQCEPAPFTRGRILGWGAGWAAIGSVYGAGAGALVGRQRWERIIPPRTSLGPVPGGIGVRVSFGG